MHRHGYKGTKFGRKRDPRRALIKSLSESLILNESIKTTLPKAKEVVSYTEKLITKAKEGNLHSRRQVIKSLLTLDAAHKLVDEISPKLTGRNSGYFRITKTVIRRGDSAQLAKVVSVDKLAQIKTPEKTKPTKNQPAKTEQKKPVESVKSGSQPQAAGKIQAPKQLNQAAKRTGRRGDR